MENINNLLFGYSIYLNLYSLTSLIAATIALYSGMVLVLVFRTEAGRSNQYSGQSSRATLHLGLVLILMGIFSLIWFATHSYYAAEIAIYAAWLLYAVVPLLGAHLTQWILQYRGNPYPRFARVALAVQYLLAAGIWTTSFLESANAELLFVFGGHAWSAAPSAFADSATGANLGFVALVTMLFPLAALIARLLSLKVARWRWDLFWITFFIATALLLPAFLDYWSYAGFVPRSYFYLSLAIFVFISHFTLLLYYVNRIRDQISMIFKVTVVAMATFLTIMLLTSLVASQIREEEYRLLYGSYAHRATFGEAAERTRIWREKKIAYVTGYDPDSRRLNPLFNPQSLELDKLLSGEQLFNWLIYERIAASPTAFSKERLEDILAETDPHFEGYRQAIISYSKTGKLDGIALYQDIRSYLDRLDILVESHRRKIEAIPLRGFAEKLTLHLDGSSVAFAPFANLLNDRLDRFLRGDQPELSDNLQPAATAATAIATATATATAATAASIQRQAVSEKIKSEKIKKDILRFLQPLRYPEQLLFRSIEAAGKGEAAIIDAAEKREATIEAAGRGEAAGKGEGGGEAIGSQAARQNFVSFIRYSTSEDSIYEVGFPYTDYREFMHQGLVLQFLIICLFIVFLLTIFPLFFRGAMLAPLRTLLTAIQGIDRGNLEQQVAIRSQSEIGILGNAFNNMTYSIRDAQKRLQEYSTNLERKVEERTQELSLNLERVNALKLQQDADYYLTSLLQKPLNFNANKSKRILTNFYVEQSKKFEFNSRQSELGGDICLTGNLRLGTEYAHKRYIAAFNGDATSEARQNAGGTLALVMGVVMNSTIARSARHNRILNATPEEWLFDIYQELQSAFSVFDGSVVVSCIGALIQEDSGELFYFNAGHPRMVLLRSRQARFVEEERQLPALGVQTESIFQATRFQLELNDVIIMGSDGRGEVDMGGAMAGISLDSLNKNGPIGDRGDRGEDRFLELVAECDGNLSALIAALKGRGNLTDDLSLLQISFTAPLYGMQQKFQPEQIIDIDIEVDMIEEEVSALFSSGKAMEDMEEAMPKRFMERSGQGLPDDLAPLPAARLQADGSDSSAAFGSSNGAGSSRGSGSRGRGSFNELFHRGMALARGGDAKGALEYLERACALQDDVPALNRLLAVLYFKQSNYPRAVVLMERFLMDYPDNREFWLYLSVAYKHQGALEKALEIAEKALDLDPDWAINLANLADIHNRLGSREKAKELAARVLELEPENRFIQKIVSLVP